MVQKIVWTAKKIVSQKIQGTKNKVKKKFCVQKIFWAPKKIGSKIFWVKQKFKTFQAPSLYSLFPTDTHQTPFGHTPDTHKTAIKFQLPELYRALISN